MNSQREREEIKKVYPKSPTWAEKVNKMSDEQVIAIYKKFLAQGKLGK